MELRGKVWKFGDHVDTDVIIPARYLNVSDVETLAKYCFMDARPGFKDKVRPGDVIVAGKNFGCGSSREHAPLAIKGAGIACVIAESFARIFYRNSFNIGLPLLESSEASVRLKEGDVVQVDLETGEIKGEQEGRVYKTRPIPPFMQELINSGGLVDYIKKKLREGRKAGDSLPPS
jgi:3-isopropylmalate/(R)-2-methylmalate dehydratase small subunit